MKEDMHIAYKFLFRKYYPQLLIYAERLLGDEEAEDVVQDVFAEVWMKPELLKEDVPIKIYLYRMVYTRSLNVIKHRKVVDNYFLLQEEINHGRAEYYHPDHSEALRRLENLELRKEINEAIHSLPEKCRETFKLSYLHQMKNKAIADVLGVSVRTVEAHMYKALKLLREKLSHLIVWVVLFLIR